MSGSRIDFSLLQHQSTSEGRHERLRTTRHFPAADFIGLCACVIYTHSH